jgi:hypothetical protein
MNFRPAFLYFPFKWLLHHTLENNERHQHSSVSLLLPV